MTLNRPLRLWPGVILAVVLVVARYVVPVVAPDAEIAEMPLAIVGMLSGFVLTAGIAIWWLFFSRAPWIERIAAVVLMVAAVFLTRLVAHESIRGGHMGMTVPLYSIPLLGLALVAWAAATRRMSDRVRRVTMVVAIVLACVPLALMRTGGVIGASSEFHWRWTPTPEDRLLAQSQREPLAVAPPPASAPSPVPVPEAPVAATAADKPLNTTPSAAQSAAPALPAPGERAARVEWPGFRGPERDSVVRGVQINTDWSQSPPVEIWRRPIGPGWSSFAVRGDVLYTQEQRGDDEIVAAYKVSTGEPVWRHRDAARFWESNAGAGPRGTPTIHDDRVYALGATGILNALDAGNGKVVWSRNAATDTGVTVPDWGIASSPLVIDNLVVVAVSGQLVAYDIGTGEQRWLGPKGGSGYSSPHLLTIDGVDQIVLLRGSRTIGVAPADGTLLWEHVWLPGVGIVQPALAPNGDVLIVVGDAMGGLGVRRIAVKKGSAGWSAEERWTTRGLKPYFNDFVIHKGHAFGFDGAILSCIDLENGERKWKGGRYGNGQLVLLADQDLLLVISEDGELALVSATSDQYKEIARLPVLNAKTWNHPVVVGDVLLVRNGEEMAAFRMPLARPLTELR
jgi:outer membrane protein assembly factor BamB